ncbi:MAG: aminodeoxychorismate/anthranilate synthase component II [Demequinaceae bacterium]|nr:aminodeoxychorismate/anthranilate synthase component II [Demequinaceae bacterium]
MARILVIDNYDSFVYTIVGYLRQMGADTTVVRNDVQATIGEVDGYDGVLVSPGPGKPSDAGVSAEVVLRCSETGTPMLGVCLGHQVLGEVFGAVVSHAPELMHGKTSEVFHEGADILAGLPSPFTATRYHSLAVESDTVPDVLEVTANTHSGIVMALSHRSLPLHGVQFHPESVLTEGGHRLLANWLAVCGMGNPEGRSQGLSPLVRD